jgi:hypothetical protein
MRVKTEIIPQTRESRGGSFFRRAPPITEYFVHVYVELTQEERAVLDQYNLWDYGLYKTVFRYSDDYLNAQPSLAADNNTPITHTVRDFVIGQHTNDHYRWRFITPSEAAAFQLKVEKEMMPLLKQIISDNMMVGDIKDTRRVLDL